MATESSPLPPDLLDKMADALRHFYDYPYLGRHPLLARLRDLLGEDPASAVQKLRGLLVEAVEALRPGDHVPADSPAWRPYQVVYNRYVLGKELAKVKSELGLGERQIQREQQRAFAEIAARLWAQHAAAAEKDALPPGDALSQEIARAAGEPQALDAASEMVRAAQAISALAQARGVPLLHEPGEDPLPALGDPALFRQLLVSALSFLVRLPATGALRLHAGRRGKRIVCSLAATVHPVGAGRPRPVPHAETARTPGEPAPGGETPPLPETILALARAAGAEIALAAGGETTPTTGTETMPLRLEIALPAAGGEWTVAIVEDNRDLAALFSRYLSRRGYRVVEIPDPQAALARIAAAQPDAVVLDVMMGGVDGWEILQRLRAYPSLRDVPVAICSVLDEAELAGSLGADSYLKKPVRPAQLLECLSRLLARPRSGAAGL